MPLHPLGAEIFAGTGELHGENGEPLLALALDAFAQLPKRLRRFLAENLDQFAHRFGAGPGHFAEPGEHGDVDHPGPMFSEERNSSASSASIRTGLLR